MTQFQASEVQQLAGLRPVDGVFKLQTAIEQIDEHLNNISTSSPIYNEFISLKQIYTTYLNEAKQLRQKGMASFRKYLAMKNNNNNNNDNDTGDTTNNVTHQLQSERHIKPSPSASASSLVHVRAPQQTETTQSAQSINTTTNNAEMMQLMEQVFVFIVYYINAYCS